MSRGRAAVTAGRVGRPHGRDGSFYVEGADHPLEPGTEVVVAGVRRGVQRRAGRPERPLVRVTGVDDRSGAAALRGERLIVEAEVAEGEWLASELVGCQVVGVGRVTRVLAARSCDLLELENGVLVPLVSDAVRSIDPESGAIEVDLGFLGMDGEP